jgi:hypothetical protein
MLTVELSVLLMQSKHKAIAAMVGMISISTTSTATVAHYWLRYVCIQSYVYRATVVYCCTTAICSCLTVYCLTAYMRPGNCVSVVQYLLNLSCLITWL